VPDRSARGTPANALQHGAFHQEVDRLQQQRDQQAERAWVAVVWAPASPWSTRAVGFTARAWTSILLLTVVRTLPIAIMWRSYY
jgi:hypothetical protein